MINSPNIPKLVVLFAVALLGQVLVFNNLHLFGFVNPYFYIVFILTLPFGTGRLPLMLWSFGLGLLIDLFCSTPGMNAAACTLIGFIRPYLIEATTSTDDLQHDDLPTMGLMGPEWYLRYMLVLVLAHHLLLFVVEQFDAFHFWPMLLRILTSSLATMLTILLAQLFLNSPKSWRD